MDKISILAQLGKIGLIPTAVLDCAQHAVPLVNALQEGGIDTVEVTLRTKSATEGISLIKKNNPDFLVGAGTVLNVGQAEQAMQAGADYIVSPGFSPETVRWCQEKNIPIIPGCTTATEIQSAISMNLTVLKFFPASTSGGVKSCENFSGPFPMVKFMPTGGIHIEDLPVYARCKFIHAVGGGWIFGKSDIKDENWENITAAAKKSVEKLLGFTVLFSKTDTGSQKENVSSYLSAILGVSVQNEKFSRCADAEFAASSKKELGEKYITVTTNNISRAEYYLGRANVAFSKEYSRFADKDSSTCHLRLESSGVDIRIIQQ